MALLLSLKLSLLSFTVLFTAMVLKLSIPTLIEFAYSELPSVFTVMMTWLRPPYLYVVINGIIITIVASSKLHHYKKPVENPPDYFLDANIVKVPEYNINDVYDTVLAEEETKVMTEFMLSTPVENSNKVVTEFMLSTPVENSNKVVTEFDHVDGAVDDVAVIVTPKKDSTAEFFVESNKSLEFLDSRSEKPPVSVRTKYKKSVKSIGEGGKALRVSKPKRQETLETTWKTITEGRQTPSTKHHRKSDTWDSHDHQLPQDSDPKMTKADTIHIPNTRHVSNNSSPGLGRLRKEPSGSWKLKKDPSLSQDDLNRRVEEFINKFNEDMRLQRQESLQQYMQMVNRGAPH